MPLAYTFPLKSTSATWGLLEKKVTVVGGVLDVGVSLYWMFCDSPIFKSIETGYSSMSTVLHLI